MSFLFIYIKDSNCPQFFGTVPKSSTISRSLEIQQTYPEFKLFLPLSKEILNSYLFIHQKNCSSTNWPLTPLQVPPSLNILSPGGGVYLKTLLRLLEGCSCGEKFAQLAGICLGKELSRQVRDFLLFFKKTRKSFPANRGNFYHIKEERFSC